MIRAVKTFCRDWGLNILLHEFHKEFNSLKVRVDVDIVHIFNDFNVTARGHRRETVSTQERDTSGSVASPLLCLEALFSFSASNRLPL